MQKCTVSSHADDEVNFVIKLLAFTNEFKDNKKIKLYRSFIPFWLS